ncbi:hypothetical protein GPECTOR_38g313 [Gonium pectorale]|uniref:Transmembrane protein 231 n=1 Tax=Gonium pectorale TaxID=33097 RepID=A0A150GB61_GONPE|nr:hypothetical protein GPECTOR_38g313 [Gonium pectorale]|eukprot:KXZ47076.1 hypothetical protein GPECTOR_38g313 [Gonium pectorale]
MEEDLNNDGKPDVILFKAAVAAMFPVHSVKALLQFQYSLTLTLQAKNQLTDRRYSAIYNVPLLNSTSPSVQTSVQPGVELEFQSILKAYLDRNYTTTYANQYPVWTGGTRNAFELQIRVRIPANQVVYYRPQVIEMLKGGWIQWLATYIVLWYLLQWVEWFVFTFRLVETRIVSDFTPKRQHF